MPVSYLSYPAYYRDEVPIEDKAQDKKDIEAIKQYFPGMRCQLRIKRMIIWMILAESMLILSTRLGAFLHEFIGHGFSAALFGGRFESFRLTLFAGGEAKISGNFGEMASVCIGLGGIVINLVTGFLVLILLQKRKASFSLTLFGLFLAGVSILSQIQYMILGAYYRYGDPACLMEYPRVLFISWTWGLLMLAYFAWYIMRLFFQLQDASFPIPNLLTRAMLSCLILGLPVFLYSGLYHCAKIPLGSTAAIHEARIQAEKEAARIKAETGSEKAIDEIRRDLEPYPILPLILAIYLLTTILAFFSPAQSQRERDFPLVPVSYIHCFTWIILSGVVLSCIAFLWGV